MSPINPVVLRYLVAVAAYAPPAFVYIAIAVVCWKKGLSEKPPKGMHQITVSMGQTFCLLWILVAPLLLLMVAALLGQIAMTCWNLGGVSLYVALWLNEKKNWVVLPIILGVFGVASFFTGVHLMMIG